MGRNGISRGTGDHYQGLLYEENNRGRCCRGIQLSRGLPGVRAGPSMYEHALTGLATPPVDFLFISGLPSYQLSSLTPSDPERIRRKPSFMSLEITHHNLCSEHGYPEA